MEQKEIRKRVLEDLKSLRSDWSFAEKLSYLRDRYANACAYLLSRGFIDSAKMQAQVWRYVDDLSWYVIEKNLKEFEIKKAFQKILAWR